MLNLKIIAIMLFSISIFAVENCPVSGEPVDSMGEPYETTINDEKVKFCCKSCVAPYKAKLQSQKEEKAVELCPTSGQPVDSMGGPYIETINDKEVKFCCKGCVEPYKAKLAEKPKKEVVDAETPTPIVEKDKKENIEEKPAVELCPTSGQPIDSMGGAYIETINDKEVKFCCKGCVEPYKAKLAEKNTKEEKEEKITIVKYTKDTCVVSGAKLTKSNTVVFVHENQELKFCCKGCLGTFKADPKKYLNKDK